MDFLLLPFLYIGVTFAACLFSLLIFFLIKYIKTKRKEYLIFSVCIGLILVYASIDVSPSVEGRVVNAINENPVAGIEVLRIFETTDIVLNPGGEYGKPKWTQKSRTDNNGVYRIPVSVHVKMPSLSFLSDVEIDAPMCHSEENQSRYCPWENYSMISFDNSRFENEYTYASGLIGNDIYLIPKLNKIEECDVLEEKDPLNKFENKRTDINISIDNEAYSTLRQVMLEKKELLKKCRSANAR